MCPWHTTQRASPGLGLIQAPQNGLSVHPASVALVEVLNDLRPQPMPVSLLYAHRRNPPQRVRVFMDCGAETLKPDLAP